MSTPQSPYAYKPVADEQPRFFRDMTNAEKKSAILEGRAPDAGPLTIFMVKYPLTFWAIVATLATGAFIWGCITAIQV
jgi:hypothetical protein